MTKAELVEKWTARKNHCDEMSDNFLHYYIEAKAEDNADKANIMLENYQYWLGKWAELREILEDIEQAAN